MNFFGKKNQRRITMVIAILLVIVMVMATVASCTM